MEQPREGEPQEKQNRKLYPRAELDGQITSYLTFSATQQFVRPGDMQPFTQRARRAGLLESVGGREGFLASCGMVPSRQGREREVRLAQARAAAVPI